MQARRIARELALLSISQLPAKQERLTTQKLQDIVVAAIRTLATDAHDTLETAVGELQRGNSRLLSSETRASDVDAAREMVREAIDLTETAINRVGRTFEIPELLQLANQPEVRAYSLEILTRFYEERQEVDQVLTNALVGWQLDRLARVDRDILRIAVTEMMYLGLRLEYAINEAVELAKRYSDEEGYKFINGVLRRVTEQIKASAKARNS
ncbi:transcription antitermination factor NusB [Phormidesmis priestleyi ULC007]|uniref:Transcription antitermination protein NusB n=1 Tax=Phormidesmis priestleyi ULC007 TaxID=1920490 RepID=A0A2T1DJD8_9CYAN|nr:transcription antitermination factor NusB [Phormidesmis priestleyi]PSB20618.1 transcription antitermination factor NusB [Phormidesmis priestleyi ULC007]PZO54288.1 MAG: transcription antitermination factor NusB [Phormidesmis priestleyi]